MLLPLYQVDSFAERTFLGNPAAVCSLPRWLPDDVLQSIAEENNLSETAFLVSDSGHEIRWFTPVCEVDLCGHATLAAAHVLFEELGLPGTRVSFESRSGTLHVTKESDLLTLDFPTRPATRCDTPPELVDALGAAPAECHQAKNYMAVFQNEGEIRRLAPDFSRLASLDVEGVIVTAVGESTDFVSRYFAPQCGIDEDPVTGSAHCTLAPYWAERLDKRELSAAQLSKRTGQLRCVVAGERVLISGKVQPYLKGQIRVDG